MNTQDTNLAADATEIVFELLGASDSLFDTLGLGNSTAPAEMASDETSTNQPWILCVEDDRDFSLALKLRLERHGISVIRAFAGVEGLQTAFTQPAEAIILDYNLPNGRGDYVLRRLKANPLTREIPVIVVSGQKHPGLEKEMLHLGAAAFLAKPVRFDSILHELQRWIPTDQSQHAGHSETENQQAQ